MDVTPYHEQVLALNPSVYHRLGEPSGTNANDETANNRDGTYQNTPTLGADGSLVNDADTAVDLNGSDEYISTAYDPWTAAAGATVTVFGRAWRDLNTNFHTLFSGEDSGTTGRGPWLYVNTGSSDVIFRPDASVSGAGQQATWVGAWPGTGEWVSWALVFRDAANTVSLYINGALVGTVTGITQTYSANPGVLQWGRLRAGFGALWNGKMDENALVHGELTLAQIQDLHYAAIREEPQLDLPDERTEPWRVIFAEPTSGTHVGEILDATERKASFKLYQPSTIEMKLPIQEPMASEIITRGEGLLIAYKGNTCQLTAEIDKINVVGDASGTSVHVVAVETMFPRLKKRLLGKSVQGYKESTAKDQGLAVQQRLDALNAESNTGIANGTLQATSDFTGGPWRFHPFIDWLMELALQINGFDYFQYPLDPNENGGYTGLLIVRSTFGTDRTNDVFIEYGGLANARDFRYAIDNEGVANVAYVLPSDFPDNAAQVVKSASDSASITARLRREAVVPNDLKDATLRQTLANEHVAVRKQPRELFEFNPGVEGGGYEFGLGADYFLGDIITGRVNAENGALLLDGDVRVYGAELEISNSGDVSPTLFLVREE